MSENGRKAAVHALALGAAAFLEDILRLLIERWLEWRRRRKNTASQKRS